MIYSEVAEGLKQLFAREIPEEGVFRSTDEEVASEIQRIAMRLKVTVSGAESVTGGLVSAFLTDIPGSSDYFLGTVVCYSVRSKVEILKVRRETIESYGVVSTEVAEEMAEKAKQLFGSDISFAVTGYAGPPRGDEKEPAGTVCFCFADTIDRKYVLKKHFEGERVDVRRKAASLILRAVYTLLLEAEKSKVKKSG